MVLGLFSPFIHITATACFLAIDGSAPMIIAGDAV
jgi:hypothetical protein